MNWSPGSHSFENAAELAKKAIALDETLPEGLCLLGNVYLWQKQHEKAISLYEKAIRLEPNYALGLAELGGILNYAQRPQEAIELLKKAIRLNPLLPGYPLYHLGHS
ncbi:MAG: tetratricopeptide repeat protein, partial [Desulfobacteraceae bacterium]